MHHDRSALSPAALTVMVAPVAVNFAASSVSGRRCPDHRFAWMLITGSFLIEGRHRT